jgi:ribosomal protein L28
VHDLIWLIQRLMTGKVFHTNLQQVWTTESIQATEANLSAKCLSMTGIHYQKKQSQAAP